MQEKKPSGKTTRPKASMQNTKQTSSDVATDKLSEAAEADQPEPHAEIPEVSAQDNCDDSDSLPEQEVTSIPRALFHALLRSQGALQEMLANMPTKAIFTDGKSTKIFDVATQLDKLGAYGVSHPQTPPKLVFEIPLLDVQRWGQIAQSAIIPEDLSDEELMAYADKLDIDSQVDANGPEGAEANAATGEGERDLAERLLAYKEDMTALIDDSTLICTECGASDLERESTLLSMRLKYTKTPPTEIQSTRRDCLFCTVCGNREVDDSSISRGREAFGKLLAKRLILGLEIDRRDLLGYMEDLTEAILQGGVIMADMLERIATCMVEPGKDHFTEDGRFNGVYVLPTDNDWLVSIFGHLVTMGAIENVGGYLYRQIPYEERVRNPFSIEVINDLPMKVIN